MGAFASVASIQLMLKHRCHELADSKWLQEYEEKHSKCRPVHSAGRAYAKMTWVTRRRSHVVWIVALVAFGLAALLTFILTLVRPELFGRSP